MITTGTVTSAKIMADRLPAGIIHQFAPVDHPRWINRFLDHWKPDLALWLESEFWPNSLSALAGRSIPIVLVNARISPKSFAGWRRFRRTIGTVLDKFSLCLAQSIEDSEKLTALGARNVRIPGNLKFAAAALPAKENELQDLANMIGDRPVWAAASTHPGEEESIAAVHAILTRTFPNLLTLIVPRHPVRGAEIAHQLRSDGHHVAQRATEQSVNDGTGIYVMDTVNELGLVYRLAPIAFIGGSLVPHGGQNLLEAAKLNCAIIHGPWMTNFSAIVAEMREASATIEISDVKQLTAAVTDLLQNEDLRASRIAAAAQVAWKKDGILDNVLADLKPFLDAACPGRTISALPEKCHAPS
jgi:3-deoxy-D-manno-octulosonic-acid transferase